LHSDQVVLFLVGKLAYLFDNFAALALAFSSDQLDIFSVDTDSGHELVF
jgi:hypothetical protein